MIILLTVYAVLLFLCVAILTGGIHGRTHHTRR